MSHGRCPTAKGASDSQWLRGRCALDSRTEREIVTRAIFMLMSRFPLGASLRPIQRPGRRADS
jgi:hypothetical protein